MASGISIRVNRQASRDVRARNVRFAHESTESTLAPRGVISRNNARTLAREIVAMTQQQFSAASTGSPLKRAKPRVPKRNAAVVPGDVDTADDVDVSTRALGDPQPLVREHAPRAAAALRGPEGRPAASSADAGRSHG